MRVTSALVAVRLASSVAFPLGPTALPLSLCRRRCLRRPLFGKSGLARSYVACPPHFLAQAPTGEARSFATPGKRS
eukprot:613185-Lingulodinium_polyedra.AAC.1